MREQSERNLEDLAREDPVSRPLATLQLEALRASADPTWDEAVSSAPSRSFTSGVPALDGQRIQISPRKVHQLLNQLGETLADSGGIEPGQTIPDFSEESVLALLRATMEWDTDTLARLADDTGAEPAIVATLGQCAALPLVLACGRHFLPGHTEIPWQPGYCPVCGSWPLLAEQRGLDRRQWLRCNRCAASWKSRHQRCVFCDNTDHETLGYMAPEAERESRRVVTCDSCHSYLKVFATVSALTAEDILRVDLQSLELDIAAIDAGYGRPERPGYTLRLELVPVEDRVRRWLPWL